MEVNLTRKGRARPRLLNLLPYQSTIGAHLSALNPFTPLGSAFPLAETWNSLKALRSRNPSTLRIGESHV